MICEGRELQGEGRATQTDLSAGFVLAPLTAVSAALM